MTTSEQRSSPVTNSNIDTVKVAIEHIDGDEARKAFERAAAHSVMVETFAPCARRTHGALAPSLAAPARTHLVFYSA